MFLIFAWHMSTDWKGISDVSLCLSSLESHHARVGGQPAFLLTILGDFAEQALVHWVAELVVDIVLVAGHVFRDEGKKTQCEFGVHVVDVHVY